MIGFALNALNMLTWIGVPLLLAGSLLRIWRGRPQPDDEVLGLIALVAMLIAAFNARRIFAYENDDIRLAFSVLSFVLSVYALRIAWGRRNART